LMTGATFSSCSFSSPSSALCFRFHAVVLGSPQRAMKADYVCPSSKYVRTGFKLVTPTNVLGNPHPSTKEACEKILEKVTEMYLTAIKWELSFLGINMRAPFLLGSFCFS